MAHPGGSGFPDRAVQPTRRIVTFFRISTMLVSLVDVAAHLFASPGSTPIIS